MAIRQVVPEGVEPSTAPAESWGEVDSEWPDTMA
jgi:hypothetical protein